MRRALATAITLASAVALAGPAPASAASAPASAAPASAAPASAAPASAAPASAAPASAAPASAAPASAAPASAAPASALAGAEHFRIISVAASARRQSVLATGAFTRGGYQVAGQVAGLRAVDRMVFDDGSFLVTRHITHQVLPLPTSACQISETIRGSLSIGSGRGAYRGISGSGGFTIRISGVIRKSHGKCGGPMTVYQSINYETASIRG